MLMDALQLLSLKFFGKKLQPGTTVSDHSDAYRKVCILINIFTQMNKLSMLTFLFVLATGTRICLSRSFIWAVLSSHCFQVQRG